MRNQLFKIIGILLLVIIALVACKKTYFNISQEVYDNNSYRYTTKESFYMRGKSIALTEGKFELTPSDSVVLFVKGQSTGTHAKGKGFARFDLVETALVYVTMPNTINPGKYNIKHKSICEINGNMNYQFGENLFICQNGQVVVDSLDGERIYGRIKGTYLNTKNQSLIIDGNIKATQK